MTTSFFFFFNDTATTEIYTLSLHDALPIYIFRTKVENSLDLTPEIVSQLTQGVTEIGVCLDEIDKVNKEIDMYRSEEHTSELQSQSNLVCRLLLEKKKNNKIS